MRHFLRGAPDIITNSSYDLSMLLRHIRRYKVVCEDLRRICKWLLLLSYVGLFVLLVK